MEKTAAILLNLGGPNSPNEIKKFLFNLFYDKAIIRLPNPFRWIIAITISNLRHKTAKKIYSHLGGKSPILEETEKQKNALQNILKNKNIEIFISMRYSYPDSNDVVKKIKNYDPDRILLIPLYPQFSTTTTKSSIDDVSSKIKKIPSLSNIKITSICCYFTNKNFLKAHCGNINEAINDINVLDYRILFSAHSLPEKIIKNGDPYQWQIEETVSKIVEMLQVKDLDYKITYQSKVTPVKWIGPSTEDEIKIASKEKKTIIIVPIAFVSEHSETLVELDIEYAKIAKEAHVKYIRIPALGTNKYFIDALAEIILENLNDKKQSIITSNEKHRLCPAKFVNCPCEGSVNG